MKAKLLLLSFFLISHFSLLISQVPQGFSYQAIARGPGGTEIANTPIQVKVSILSDTAGFYVSGSGTYIWEEIHSVTTNSGGMFTLIVGNPLATKVQGSATSFSLIDWKQKPIYIGTKINFSGWKNMGTSPLWTVPYSMIAGDLLGSVKKLEVMGADETTDEALFEVKRRDGETMFAVYNHGVRVFMPLDTLSKGKKGGFAIGGFDKAKGITTFQDYFVVTPDLIRAYVDTSSAKGTKGGFAIGGFSKAKGTTPNFMEMTPSNYFIGEGSGSKITTGKYNSFFGYQSGLNNTSGGNNAFIGYQAGLLNSSGSQNVFMGYLSGIKNTTGAINVFVGSYSGNQNSTGTANVYIGSHAGEKNTTGYQNISIGDFAGSKSTDAWRNVYIGYESAGRFANSGYNTFVGSQTGADITTGMANTLLGYHAGVTTQTGSFNVFIGMKAAGATDSQGSNRAGDNNVYIGAEAGHKHAGSRNVLIGAAAGGKTVGVASPGISGSGNIFIGFQSGFEEMGSDKLYIDNSGTSLPLIYGDFTDGSEKLVFNGNVGIGTASPGYKLQVGIAGDGSQARANAWNLLSDATLKTGFIRPEDPIRMLSDLNGYYFYWSTGSDKTRQFGFSAQEVEKVLPEVVSKGADGLLSLDYGKVTPLLLEAMKEQQLQIESTKQENFMLKTELQFLKERLEKIEALLAKSGAK